MTEPIAPEDLAAEIQTRARALMEVAGDAEQLAAIDFQQFAIGSYFGAGAAMLVLREHNLLRPARS